MQGELKAVLIFLLPLVFISTALAADLVITTTPAGGFCAGDTIQFFVNINMGTTPANGISAYFSFDDDYFSVIDQNSTQTGIQPFIPGGFMNGTVLENDTHGDPGNAIPLFQLDYTQITPINTSTSGSGLLASFKLITIETGDSIAFTVDQNPPARNTAYSMPDSSYSYHFDNITVPILSVIGPQPVTDLTITPTGAYDITLSWTHPDTIFQYTYSIYRSENPYFDYTQFQPAAQVELTTYIDPGARLEDKYFYQVISQSRR